MVDGLDGARRDLDQLARVLVYNPEFDQIAAYIEYAIRTRTLRSEFLPGSSPNPSQYRSRQYRKWRERRGHSSKVNLTVTGQMLAAMRRTVTPSADGTVTIEVGYLEDSPSDEAAIAAYHDRTGAGTSRILRKFVGLTAEEEDRAVQMAKQIITKGLDR